MDAFGEIGLVAGEVDRRFFAKGDEGRIDRLDRERAVVVFIAQPFAQGVHVSIAARDDAKGREPEPAFFHFPVLVNGRVGMEGEPHGFGHAVGGLIVEGEAKIQVRLMIR